MSKDVDLTSATIIEREQTVTSQGHDVAVSGEYVADGGVVSAESYAASPLPEEALAMENGDAIGGCNQCESTTRYEVRRVFCRGRSTCNMPPHMAYYPEAHGYYYFRPYNWPRVVTHQNIVTRWGGDWRHPYANEVFDRVYAQLGVERHTAHGADHSLVPVPPETLPSAPPSSEPAMPDVDDGAPGSSHDNALPESDSLESPPAERGSSLPRLNDAVETSPRRLLPARPQQPAWDALEADLLAEDQAEAELVNFVKRRNRSRQRDR